MNDLRNICDLPLDPRAGPTLRERLHTLACQLAEKAERNPPQVTQADYEQAKREITGEDDLERQNAILDAGKKPPLFLPAR